MKKLLGLAVLIISFLVASLAGAATDISVLVNNKQVSFPDQKPYLDSRNRTLVPVRFVSEALGAKVEWDDQTQLVTIVRRKETVKLRIGENSASVNGQTKTFDTQAVIHNSRTMVPLRFISETLGAQVTWLAKTKTVKIIVDNGYTIPGDTEVKIEIHPPNQNPNKVDICMNITVFSDMEAQLTDLSKIISSKLGADGAKQITDYVRQKKDRWSEVPAKWWTINNQLVFTGSGSGDYFVEITVWQPGVSLDS